MATSVHPKHAAAIVEKTVRWSGALEQLDALRVPAALVALEATGKAGTLLADDAWSQLAVSVSLATGKRETAPTSTRRSIAQMCADRAETLAFLAKQAKAS